MLTSCFNMAGQATKTDTSWEDHRATTKELLSRFTSTVFECDTSGDTRYIRCNFPQCREHAESLQGKPCWILNTLRNVKVLENHVTNKVHHYMKEMDCGTDNEMSNSHFAESQQWIEKQQLPAGTRKVLAVLNLKDPQSQFGDWISLFLKAAYMAEGLKDHSCLVITQNFVSRHELMECIAKLKFLNMHKSTVEVVAVLSCHSSCQGQVFSCTPFSLSKQCGSEEFCSLHDVVMACQTVLMDVLKAVHISSCFTLKLDCSHTDWPVEAHWLKTKLRCILSGSTKEVYETGSQVADLHLMLSTMLCSNSSLACGTQLKDAVDRACLEGFPDLAREMGLEVLGADKVDDKLLREGKEDQVTPPGQVISSVRVVICVQVEDENVGETFQDSGELSPSGSYIALAHAITANLQIRKSSDVKFEYNVLQIKISEMSSLRESLKRDLSLLPCDDYKVLFVAIGPIFAKPSVDLLELVNEWSDQRTGNNNCYGVHFQHISAMQAYVIKNKLREIRDARVCENQDSVKELPVRRFSVTGLVDNGDRNCSASFPVLLYMIHLAVGENGNRLAGKGIPSAVYSNKPVGHGISSWTLEEVYMETSHVLSGLSRKCGLHLLSPASNLIGTTVAQCQPSIGPTSSETSESCQTKSEDVGLSSSAISHGENTGLPVEERFESKQVDFVGPRLESDTSTCRSREISSVTVNPIDQKPADSYVKKELPATSVLNNTSLSSGGMNAFNLHSKRDHLNLVLVDLKCRKKELSKSSSFTESGKFNEENASGVELHKDVSEFEINPFGARTSDKLSASTARADFSEGEKSLGGRDEPSLQSQSAENDDDRKLKPSFGATSCTTNKGTSQNRDGIEFSLQARVEKEQKSLADEKDFDGPPHKRKKEKVLLCVLEDFMSGTLQSTNKCPGVFKREGNCQLPASLEMMPESTESDVITSERASNSCECSEASEMDFDSTCEESFSRKRASFSDFSRDKGSSSGKKSKHDSAVDSGRETVAKELQSAATNDWDRNGDLPLMASVKEVLVKHYILDLSVKFSEKVMKGSIVLLVEPRNEEVTQRQFQMTLDSTLVNIESVSEVVLPDDFKLKFYGQEQNGVLEQNHEPSSGVFESFLGNILGDKSQTNLPFKRLPYSVYGWFVQIWKPDALGKAWPRCIWIKYHTSPEGKSLTWATDQDGKPCVYSPGAYINNRSLMPCQEPPVAMSTWQAAIHVPEGCNVLMSGNELLCKTTASNDQVTFLYEMSIPLPCSTLAIAVGWWLSRKSRNAETKYGDSPHVPITCRLFAPTSLIDSAADEMLGYAPQFLEASCELLGPYPFRRLDILVLPKCFACMGLKSPNLVFLSQSVLSGDGSMRVRLAHEISHAWFGLLIGAKDWSEEWLSEGFATFIEEKIQARAEKWSNDKDRFYREMRHILRHRCLLSEIKECDDNLKYLRPKVIKPPKALSTAEAIENSVNQPDSVRPHSVVQFGQICSRKWTQVHYLKGYFLLHHLATMVGRDQFDNFLYSYVQHYKERLVTSEDFFKFFSQSFPDISSATMDEFIHEWLEMAGLPKRKNKVTDHSFPKRFDSRDNELIWRVEEEFQIWKKLDAVNKRRKTLGQKKRTNAPTSVLEVPEQVVLFLEKLLERETLSHTTLRQLDRCYVFSSRNAEVRHRWCELIVKHKYNPGLQEVKRFLIEDQGMGIYLFGELIISQQAKQRALVDEVLQEIGAEMDQCTYQTVKDMLEGKE